MGPIRQSLSHESASGTARTRHLCVRLSRKDCKQKEIGGIPRKVAKIPHICIVFYLVSPPRYLTAPAGSVRPGFFVPPVTALVPPRPLHQQFPAQTPARSRSSACQISRRCFEFAPAVAFDAPPRSPVLFVAAIVERNHAPEPHTS